MVRQSLREQGAAFKGCGGWGMEIVGLYLSHILLAEASHEGDWDFGYRKIFKITCLKHGFRKGWRIVNIFAIHLPYLIVHKISRLRDNLLIKWSMKIWSKSGLCKNNRFCQSLMRWFYRMTTHPMTQMELVFSILLAHFGPIFQLLSIFFNLFFTCVYERSL
jgi:hypothetical protein